MKRTVKRILPILIGIVMILSIAWYLFVYDQGFTRDVLVSGARFFDEQGNHSIAAWLYNQAYNQSIDNESIAIELADRFKEMGNYTKAENTLTGAIYNKASAQLYIALSKTYVQQDKLLDAVKMLDNITDPEIKAQLDLLRPAAPTVDTTPGFYNQYLPIKIASEGKLYLTTDGQYPSVTRGVSDGNVALVNGENTIYALAISETGLVSTLSIFGYTIGGVIEPVNLADPAIDSAVRQALGFGSGIQLQSSQLWEITALTLPEGAGSYKDLARLSYLRSLTIHGGAAQNLEGMENLTQLTELTITGGNLSATDLLIIAGLPKLEKLTLTDCGLSSITNLSKAPSLTYLDLSNNAIRDIAPLSFMTKLLTLNLSHNALTNLNALSALSNLQSLDISYNSLVSLVPLAGCTGLQTLLVNNNSIAALSGIEALVGLKYLDASYNALTEITPVSSCVILAQLDVSNNSLVDISCLSSLSQLQVLNFSRNGVTTLPQWAKNCALVTIDGSYNKLKTIATLAGYENLNNVLMDYNEIKAVNALSACHNLIKVSVYGNPVKDVDELENMSIIVNYNPL